MESTPPLLDDLNGKDALVGKGTVAGIAFHELEVVEHVEAFGDLAEHGVGAVEVGCPAPGAVNLAHGRGEAHERVGLLVEALLQAVELVIGEGLSGDDVELPGRRGTLRVDGIVLAGHGESPGLVEVSGETYFGRNGVRLGRIAESHSGQCMARGGVTRLDHEGRNDAVEEQAVVVVGTHMAEEVVAMQRRVVEEHSRNRPLAGKDAHPHALRSKGRRKKEKKKPP